MISDMDFCFDIVCVDYQIPDKVNYQSKSLASQDDHLVESLVLEEDSFDRHNDEMDREEDKNRQDSVEVLEGADNFYLYKIAYGAKN